MEISMKTSSSIALAIAALASAASAQATAIDATFTGVVQSQIGTGVGVNSPISGEFIYDTALSAYTLFTIGGLSVAPGFASQADLSPDHYTALYTAQLSPVATGGDVNSTFSVDLEALSTPWTAGTALALLTSPELATNLDTALSSFTYYTANSNGTNLQTLTATLTGIQVSAVPEPASLALLLAGVAVVGLVVRRSKLA
jgi:hypothetical protein